MPAASTDDQYLQRALDLARASIGLASPNPYVGAVITDSDGNVVGSGIDLLRLLLLGRIIGNKRLDLGQAEPLQRVAYLLQGQILLLEPLDKRQAGDMLLRVFGGASTLRWGQYPLLHVITYGAGGDFRPISKLLYSHFTSPTVTLCWHYNSST